MMHGLLLKVWRESWAPTLLFGLAMFIVKILLGFTLPHFQDIASTLFEAMPFMSKFLSGLLGMSVGTEFTGTMIQATLWVHPIILTLLWANEIIHCTRCPAGEIDRGTIDILLGWPVSRWQVYMAESIGWLASGAFIVSMALLGHLVSGMILQLENPVPLGRIAIVLLNLFLLYGAAGGVAYFISALSERRARAIATIFTVVLASFLLNFLAQFWEPANMVSWLSVLHYFQPAEILSGGGVPWVNLGILLGMGAALWGLGGVVFARRSICTV